MKKKILILLSLILIISLGSGIYYYFKYIKFYHLDKERVFVCDNKDKYSKFDDWLKKDLEIDWVPTFVIIYDNTILDQFASRDVKELDDKIGSDLIAYNSYKEMNNNDESYNKNISNEKITNLNGKSISFSSLVKDGGLYILEVHKAGCPDCEEYDKIDARNVRKKYGGQLYRYYIKSSLKDVKKIKL